MTQIDNMTLECITGGLVQMWGVGLKQHNRH